ncbi:MAG TPA: xylulokinase [Geminicoccaceae bacterium]|nr:xylulokinase [Geminicoccaceae bacterium]
MAAVAADGRFIGLDVGTSGVKGVLIDGAGAVLARHTVGYPILTPRPGWTEQEPETWWRAACDVLRELGTAAAGVGVDAVGLAGQMHGAVFLDRDGAVIRPAPLWNDQRTAAECAEIERRVGAARLRRITGNPALTGFQAPKILWLRDSEPEAYRRVRHVLLPKDYVRYRLTGALATDASDAAGTLLLDLRARDWSAEVLGALEVPRDWLPRVYEGPEVTGPVSAEGAAATGLAAGVPVVAGGGDNAAAAVGSGVVRDGTGLVSLGTSGVVFVHTDEARIDPSGALHAFCHAVPGRYHLMAVMLSAGGSLRWFRDAVVPELAARAAAEGRDVYDGLTAGAAEVAPGADGLFFLPYLAGERTPHMDPDVRGGWLGLGLNHDRRHMVRALLEGVAFGLRDGLELIRALEAPPERLFAVGGGTAGPLWRAILAAALDVPLQRLAAEEGPAFGAALLASVGAGAHPDVGAAVAAAVRPRGPVEPPDPELRAVYARLYPRFRALYPAVKASGG